MMKKLYLVRHAKSSWKDQSLSDLQRPLNCRGLKNAPEMGQRLVKADVSVELIVSSPANRALTTARFLAQAMAYDAQKIIQDDLLYFEGISAILQIIQSTKPHIESLMLVGHNPDMTSLLNHLCGFQTVNMPTCAMGYIQFDNEWSEVTHGSGTLLNFDFPKNSDPM